MADVITRTRTNWFRPSDPEALKRFIARAYTDGAPLSLQFNDKGEAMFCCAADILGVATKSAIEAAQEVPDFDIMDDPDANISHSLFMDQLMGLVADGDACTVMTIGHEAMRSIWADAYIVTPTGWTYLSFEDAVRASARENLCDRDWDTVFEG